MSSAGEERRRGELPEGEAHVWKVELSARSEDVAALFACLSAEERARVERQRTPDAEQRFVQSRLALRHILARYTGESAASIELVVSASGKPSLAVDRSLHFSLTHAGRLALVGVARADIGIDVERVRDPRRLLTTARRFLHADTVAVLQRLGADERRIAFFDAWTQRESHVKAEGGGLFLTPDALPFDLTQEADGVPRICMDLRDGHEWTVVRFVPAAGTRASLVARGRLTRVRYFDWSIDTTREETTDE